MTSSCDNMILQVGDKLKKKQLKGSSLEEQIEVGLYKNTADIKKSLL